MHTPTATPKAEVLDPDCGMTINPADAVGTADDNGQTYASAATAA